jgi:xanthine dehydrogenase YagT iron-sulfur-binding subunit
MQFTINGRSQNIDCDVRTSLLDLLRDHLGLTGTKKGCNQGACGACTVLVEGDRINSCLALAAQYQGRSIMTIEARL